jgi:TrbL/VirB6 plasmid conjugal transfer protein
VHALPGVIQGLRDPLGAFLQLLTGVLGHVVGTGIADINSELSRYLFSTVDPTVAGSRPLTGNPTVAHLNFGMAMAADVLVAAVLLYASLRSLFERTMRARYTLKVVIPRSLAAIALVHGSVFLVQMAIDLNNAIGHVAMSLGDPLTVNTLPWSGPTNPVAVQAIQASQDLFRAVFALALVIALVILVLSYVIRTALIDVLIVVAPLAALCMVLPETRGYAHLWLRLFTVTVFMQAVQLIALRVATATGFGAGSGIAASLYALATLWIVLKVPGALHAASHVESRAATAGHHLERSLRRALAPAHAVHHRLSS